MEREAFEKFVRNKWDALGVGVVKRNEAGKYAATNIETMWETWQAALATQPLPVQEGGAKKAADAYLLSPRERGVFEHAFERGWDARGEAMTKCEESLAQPPLPVQPEQPKEKSTLVKLIEEKIVGMTPTECAQFMRDRATLAQPVQEPDALTIAYQSGYYDGKKAALAQPAQEQWNAALDEAAARIGEIKGFGKATQDSFAVYIKGLKR